MTNVNASNFRKEMFKYLEQTIRYNEPINIVTKNGNVVVMNEEEYRGILETLYIESIPNIKKEILEARKEKGTPLRGRTLEQFFAEECK
jgi:PHD/YefM family antitoxin component YafN of YafNO toxin-antitoxin module